MRTINVEIAGNSYYYYYYFLWVNDVITFYRVVLECLHFAMPS